MSKNEDEQHWGNSEFGMAAGIALLMFSMAAGLALIVWACS